MKVRFLVFWFEANQSWGLIKSLDDWRRIVRNHISGWNREGRTTMSEMAVELLETSHATSETAEFLQHGKVMPFGSRHLNFGLYSEHKTPLTMADWAKSKAVYDLLSLPGE